MGEGSRVFRGVRSYVQTSWRVFHDVPEVRRFLLANAAWEGTFAAMRTFVVLYITKGLGQPQSTSSAVLATVAVGYVIAALAAGPLGDRFGLARVIFGASFVYGAGLLVAGLAQEWHNWYFGLILPVAVAGGTVMTLSWALLFKLMPPQHRGAISGLATTTKGVGSSASGRSWRASMIDVTDAVPREHGRLRSALAGLRDSGAGGDPARRVADPDRDGAA